MKTIGCASRDSYFIDEGGGIWIIVGNKDIKQLTLSSTNNLLPRMVEVAVGDAHALFLDENGKVWVHGKNKNLHFQTKKPSEEADLLGHRFPEGTQIVTVSCGMNHSMLLDSKGYVWGCGFNSSGQLGHLDPRRYTITKNPHLKNIRDIQACGRFSLFLDKDSKVWICGDIVTQHNKIPCVIEGIPEIALFSGGLNFCFLIDLEGSVWCLGGNYNGQLGLGHKNEVSEPTKNEMLPPIRACSASTFSSMFLAEDDSVWLINASQFSTVTIPVNITSTDSGTLPDPFTSVSCGNNYSLLLGYDGSLWERSLGIRSEFQKLATECKGAVFHQNHTKSARNR